MKRILPGLSGLVVDFGLLARGRSLNDALKLGCELDLGRFDDLDLRNERRRSEACFLAFALVKRPCRRRVTRRR
jgi:hypothetical protein